MSEFEFEDSTRYGSGDDTGQFIHCTHCDGSGLMLNPKWKERPAVLVRLTDGVSYFPMGVFQSRDEFFLKCRDSHFIQYRKDCLSRAGHMDPSCLEEALNNVLV